VIESARSLVTETGNMFAITLETLRVMWKQPDAENVEESGERVRGL
jgi:hypothetical protein